MTPTSHKRATASAFGTLVHCVAPLSPDMPPDEQKTTYAAMGGTAAHSIFELETEAQKDPSRAVELRLRMTQEVAKNNLTPRQLEIARNQLGVWKRWADNNGGVNQSWWPEVAMAYDPSSGNAIIGLPKFHRDYSWVPDGWLAGTTDLCVVKPQQSLWVADYKAGRSWVEPPKDGGRIVNWQIAGLTLMAYRAFGCEAAGVDRARASIVRIAEKDYYESSDELDEFDLAAADDGLKRIQSRILAKDFKKVVGDHCTKCRVRETCPEGQELIQLRKKEEAA